MTIICSLPGCKRQQFHFDFKQVKGRRIDETSMEIPYLMIVPLHGKMTSLCILDDDDCPVKKYLQPGSIYIGRHDLLHCGSEYNNINVRLHFYVDPKEKKWRKIDTNYFASEESYQFVLLKQYYDARRENLKKFYFTTKFLNPPNLSI